ncbi:MAG TPA: CBS domain-containing protein [Jiangellales bacterium]|nr:CBS domain-containing protein [Jiangellales bacterium]
MRSRKTVADVMTPDVVTVDPQTPFKRIAHLVAEHNIRSVPVVADGDRVVGLVSVTDLLHKEEFRAEPRPPWYRRLLHRAAATKAEGRIAAELMTSPAITTRPEALVVEAVRTMAEHQITRLVVVDADGRLAGIVSRGDVLRVFLRPDEEIRESVLREIVPYAIWADPHEIDVTVSDGVVTLGGRVERKAYVPIVVSLVWGIDGVVDVVDNLRYAYEHAPPTVPADLDV